MAVGRVMRRTLRFARRLPQRVRGDDGLDTMTQLIRQDVRSRTFFEAIEFVNYERVVGDIVECGVFGGVSLALLAKGMAFDSKGMQRRVVGIDSFQGLPASEDTHPRWRAGDCATMQDQHPVMAAGARVDAAATRALFASCELPPPTLHEGLFADVLTAIVPAQLPATALLHVDCDLYESTRDVLTHLAPTFQDGTVVLFDDWFHYRAHPGRGESRAFAEFLAAAPEWHAVHWRSYATFANAFILSRR